MNSTKTVKFIFVLIVMSLPLGSMGQNKDTFKIQYHRWIVRFDSINWDSLYKNYSNFRKDTDGSLGLRLKYYKSTKINMEGLSKEQVIELLGRPNDTVTVKYNGDSIQKLILDYKIGSETEIIDSSSSKGCKYRFLVYLVNGEVLDFLPYMNYIPEPWIERSDW